MPTLSFRLRHCSRFSTRSTRAQLTSLQILLLFFTSTSSSRNKRPRNTKTDGRKQHSLRKMSSFLLEIYVRLINGYFVHEKRKLLSLYLDKLSNFCLLFRNRQFYHWSGKYVYFWLSCLKMRRINPLGRGRVCHENITQPWLLSSYVIILYFPNISLLLKRISLISLKTKGWFRKFVDYNFCYPNPPR